MIKCSLCGAVATADQRFCGECGARLVAPPNDERNAVMHRPGGGVPDPFTVGGSDDAANDDFFSQFVPKSSLESNDESEPPQPTTRRARRRFNPRLYDTGEVPTMLPKLDGQPAAPKPEQQAAPQPESQSAPESAKPAAKAEEPQHSSREDDSSTRRSQTPPAPAAPVTPQPPVQDASPFAPAPAQPAAQSELPDLPELPKLPEPQSEAVQRPEPVQPEPVQPEAPEQAELFAQPPSSAAEAPAQREVFEQAEVPTHSEQPAQPARPEQPEQPQAPAEPASFDSQEEQPAERTAPEPYQQPSPDEPELLTAPVYMPPSFLDDEPEEEPQAQPTASDDGGVERPTDSAGESTFTELIVGLDNDPADRPISSPAFNETGIVPLPQQAPTPVDPDVTAARERAAAFWSGSGGEQQAQTDPHDEPEFHEAAANDHDDDGDYTDIDALFAEPEPVERFAGADSGQPDENATRQHAPFVAPLPDDDAAQQSPFAPADAEESNSSTAGAGGMPSLPQLPANNDYQRQDAQHDSAGMPPIPVAAGAGGGGAAGGGGSAGGGEDDQEQRRRGVRVILVAAAAALVVIGGVFGVARLFGGDEGGEAAATATGSDTPGTVTAPKLPDGKKTEKPTETPTEEQQFEPVAFQSESGNIRCQITPENGVACQLLSPAFELDENQCDAGFSGAAVGLTKDGVNYPCLEGDLDGGEVLGYNEPIEAGEFNCVIDYDLGLSCNNAATDAFTMEFYAGISNSGKEAPEKNPTVPVYVP